MPVTTPFHERTSALCQSYRWKQWAGYAAVCSYNVTHDDEYFVFRHAAGMIDVTPLFKYEVRGRDAGVFLARVTSKDVRKLKQGQVTYLCWCDDDGRLIDDGTVTRMEEDWYRVTAAEPSYSWFMRYARGFDVQVEDVTDRIAAVSIQGPTSRGVLKSASDADMDRLGFFKMTEARLDGVPVRISRTGYTGDLGFEVWVENSGALRVWDALMNAGKAHGLQACGLDAMDVTRIEAGFIMNGVDYHSANHCLSELHMSTPYEVGLGWTIQLDRAKGAADPIEFVGQKALERERERGPSEVLVGLDISWTDLESLYAEHDLPPSICTAAWRQTIPVYDVDGRWIGYASSGAWSPMLKKNLALAHLKPEYGKPGTVVRFEVLVEKQRRTVAASVSALPFYNPDRKRSVIGGKDTGVRS